MKPRQEYICEEKLVKTENADVKREEMKETQKEPPFIKIYLDTARMFQGIKGINLNILISFCYYITYSNADKNQMQITFNKINKQEIAKTCEISVDMVNKNIKKFVDNGIFFKTECRGVYTVNPFLLAKGKWRNVQEFRSQFDFVDGEWTKQKEIKPKEN